MYVLSPLLTFTIAHVCVLDVFNTEAHPYVAPAAKRSYGSGKLYPTPTRPFQTNAGEVPLVSPAAKIPATRPGGAQ